MSCAIPQSVYTDCRKHLKSRIDFNNFNTFNNVTRFKVNKGHNMYKTEKDAIDSIERIKEIMFGASTDRQKLEAENTEYDYGHNVKHNSEE